MSDLPCTIIDVQPDNIAAHPQVICFTNPKHPDYHFKLGWLKKRYKEGLHTKLLYLDNIKSPVGFIEYTPGEFCWRPVSAKGYTFIHCLYTNGKKHQHQGLGQRLLDEAEKSAKGSCGLVVVASQKAFMATPDIFLKNGFETVDTIGKDSLLVKPFKKAPPPSFSPSIGETKKYQGLNIIYSNQCPWVARFVQEVKSVAPNIPQEIHFKALKTAKEAQKAPTLYGILNLIYNGKVLSDRYISLTRFKNILKKELSISLQ